MRVYDMLNTKYFVQEDPGTRQEVARINPGAYGPCWLVKAIHYVKDGNEEMRGAGQHQYKRYGDHTWKICRRWWKSEPVPDTAGLRDQPSLANHNDTVELLHFSAKSTNQFAGIQRGIL